MADFSKVVDFVQRTFKTKEFIPLHEPRFIGKEREYVNDCLDSTFVSSVGKYVDKFEQQVKDYTGAKYAIAAVNGTAALHIGLVLAGVKQDEYVLTQPLSFIATCNAISYVNAIPYFIDVDIDSLGLSADKLEAFLKENAEIKSDGSYHKLTKKRFGAVVPMHTFGHSCNIDKIAKLCEEYKIPLVEDSAESLGTTYKGKHTGTYGLLGAYSFNGNKTITCGGGGAIVTNNEDLAKMAKHITTTAKVPHRWDYVHDVIGYNYRLTNLSASLACAQMEQLQSFIDNKRELAIMYASFFKSEGIDFLVEPKDSVSNYWLNAVILKDRKQRDEFLTYTNDNGVMSRPCWGLMNKLEMFKNCPKEDLSNAEWLEDRVVNIPSSVRV